MTMKHVLVAAPEYINENALITHPDQLMQQQTIHFSLTAHADMWTLEKKGKTVKHPVNRRYRVSSSRCS